MLDTNDVMRQKSRKNILHKVTLPSALGCNRVYVNTLTEFFFINYEDKHNTQKLFKDWRRSTVIHEFR